MTEQLCPNQGEPPAAAGAEALAARPLLEQIAAMGDCIGQQTVGQIVVLSERAAAWLRENPPGQPVAIEPRGCPTPGACSCVEPPPPAAGEVAELVKWLCETGDKIQPSHLAEHQRYKRAAELLERQQPQPVPVSKRWPEFSDCDGIDRVWCWSWAIGTWRLGRINRSIHSHWLPANFLPLPTP